MSAIGSRMSQTIVCSIAVAVDGAMIARSAPSTDRLDGG
jgi:hypothetical protein